MDFAAPSGFAPPASSSSFSTADPGAARSENPLKEGNFGNLFGQSAPESRSAPASPAERPAVSGENPGFGRENPGASFGPATESGSDKGRETPAPAHRENVDSEKKPSAEEAPASTSPASRDPFGEEDSFPSLSEGFSALFAKPGKTGAEAEPAGTGRESADASRTPKPDTGLDWSRDSDEANDPMKPFDFGGPKAAAPIPDGPLSERARSETGSPGGESSTHAAAVPKPKPMKRGSRQQERPRIFSPLVIVVMLLGAMFLGGLYLFRVLGGVEGAKARLMGVMASSGVETGIAPVTPMEASVPAPADEVATAPDPEAASPVPSSDQAGGDGIPPASPGNGPGTQAPVPAPAPAPAPAVDEAPPAEEPSVAPPVADGDQPPAPQASLPAADTPPASAQPAEAQSSDDAAPAPAETAVPQQPDSAATPSVQVATPARTELPVGGGDAQAAATVEGGVDQPREAETGADLPQDPGEKMAAILEPVGEEVIRAYYQSNAIDERAAFVLDQDANQPKMEAYYRRYQSLPTLRSVSFRGPMRDAASGRWFGVFDVREAENEEVHRWCVVQVRPGEMKLDWVIYQQLIDGSLDRFLGDPTAPARDFRLVIRRGEEAPSDENPWPGTTWELYLQPPLDTSQPRVLLVRDEEFQKLGLDSALIGGNARIGRVELGWVPSDLEPLTRVPTITKVHGWGAW